MIDSESFDKAIEKSTAIIVKYPDTRWIDDALYIMGASYYYKGDYQRSLEKLDFLAVNYPQSHFYYDAQYLMGLANYKLKKYGPATVALKEVASSRKYKSKSMIALVYVYYGDGDYSNLYAMADTLLKGSLKYDEQRTVLGFVGMAQFSEGRYAEALETSTRLLAITRDETERRQLKLRIAEIYLQIGEYDLCKNFLIGEVAPEFRDLLAALYIKTGNTQEAKEICHELTQSTQADIAAKAYYELARIYESDDSTDLAVAYYDSVLMKSPTSTYSLEARKKSDVLKRIQSLVVEKADTIRAQFLLAEIYFADLDDLPKALEGYQKVYHDYPSSKWAPKALYAHLWIANKILQNDTLTVRLANDLISDYPRTEYALSAQQILEQVQNKENERGP
jgi:TolA-binding protein